MILEKPGLTALVPMRSGSKRIPGKNLRDLNGKPLFSWVIGALMEVSEVERIVVDSDSETILSESVRLFPGIETVKRPLHLATDAASMNDVLRETVKHFEGDWFLQVHATTPFLNPTEISAAFSKLKDQHEYDSCFGVTRIQSRLWDKACKPINHSLDKLLPTQDLEATFLENSAFYFFRKRVLEEENNRIGLNPLMFETSLTSAIDIDNEDDFTLAEIVARGLE